MVRPIRPRGVLLGAAIALSLLGSRCVTRDWYVLAGQSNMVGASSQVTPIAPGVVYRPIDTWYTEVADPEVFAIHDGGNHSSAWPEFALNSPHVVGLIATASGASCLLDWPADARVGRWNPVSGDLYARALAQWMEAGSPKLHAFLWYQGECDAQAANDLGLTYDQAFVAYKTALLELADAVQRDFQARMVVAPISLRLCAWDNPTCDPALFQAISPKTRPIHDATVEVALEEPNVFVGPSSDDLRLMPDGHVYDVNTLGLRWLAAVAQMDAGGL